MRPALTALLCVCAGLFGGCASMPDMSGGGLPMGKTGWQMTGGADFDKQVWFVMFWRPWGAAEKNMDAQLPK